MRKNNISSYNIVFLFVLFLCTTAVTSLFSQSTTGLHKSHKNNMIILNLERSLSIAINNSFDLKAIKARGHAYDLSVFESFREFFPSLSFTYLRAEDVRKEDSDSRQQRLSVDSEIMIYDGGKTKLAYDIARLKRILSIHDYKIAVNKLIMEVMNAYLQLLQIKDSIEIHKKTLENGMRQLTFIKKEFKVGSATKFHVLEIEAKVKEIELNVKKAQDEYTLALNKYKYLLKLDWRNNIDVVGSIENDFTLKPLSNKIDVREYISKAITNRKEIQNTSIEYNISRKSYYLNKLYYFPKFYIGLNYTLSDDKYKHDQYIPREKGWGITFKVSSALVGNSANLTSAHNTSKNNNQKSSSNTGVVSVLDDVSYKRRIVESKIDMETAKFKKKDMKQQVSIEVLSSFSALKNTWEMIKIADKQLELYDTQLKIERLKANMGESRRYDLIKKEIERGEAAISKLGTKVKYISAVSNLELAMGVRIGYLKLYKIIHKKK